MECRDYRKEYRDFLEDTLAERETEKLLKHLAGCNACMEELRIQYLLIEGMKRLESGGTFDINSDFERMLGMRRKRATRGRKLRYTVYAVLFAAVFVSYYFMIHGILI